MATLMTTNGLQRVGVQASQATSGGGPTYSATRHIQTMSVDDTVAAFVAGDTALGSPTNSFDKAFDAAPTRTTQTISHAMTLATAEGNFTLRRLALHDDTAANVTGASATVCAGIDGLTLTKNATFTLKSTFQVTYS